MFQEDNFNLQSIDIATLPVSVHRIDLQCIWQAWPQPKECATPKYKCNIFVNTRLNKYIHHMIVQH